MKIQEAAKLTGVTVRTLQYYDKIGLLKPAKLTEAGYRCYEEKELETLQQILFFRELDFPLEEIKVILQNPQFDKGQALKNHKELLMKKRERIDGLISLAMRAIQGEEKMSFKEFDMSEIENTKKKYAKEAKERWGDSDAYRESRKRADSYGKEEWKKISRASDGIMKEFAAAKDTAPDSKEAKELVKKWQDHINTWFYPCSNEILQGLGQMYLEDIRFQENIDQNGAGTAAFMSRAIEAYCAE